jgi:hypothetical protein
MAEYIEREVAEKTAISTVYRVEGGASVRLDDEMHTAMCSIPAADVVEVRHGKYIQASKTAQIGLKCSICGARIKYSEHFNGNHHYCYKCGAKMDGKGEGE